MPSISPRLCPVGLEQDMKEINRLIDFKSNDIRIVTGGRCDMLLYCVSLLPDSKINKEDREVIKKLTLVFGKEVWRHTVLVLTFTNAVKALYPEQSIKDIVEEYAQSQKFQSALHFAFKSDISVVSIFLCDHTKTQREADTIIAVPAGYSPDERFIKNFRQGWDEMIFGEVLKKCNPDAVPVLLETKHPLYPRIVRMPLNVCSFLVGTVGLAAIGGQPLGLVTGFLGAKLGELIRWFTPIVGTGLGATIGYVSGFGVAGVIVGFGLFNGLQEAEENNLNWMLFRRNLNNTEKRLWKSCSIYSVCIIKIEIWPGSGICIYYVLDESLSTQQPSTIATPRMTCDVGGSKTANEY